MTLGTGGIAAGVGGPMQEEEDDLNLDGDDLDLGDEGSMGDEGAGDLGDDLGDDMGDLGLGDEGDEGNDVIDVDCPDCGSAITVRLVPEVESGDDLDLEGPGLDDEGPGLDDEGPGLDDEGPGLDDEGPGPGPDMGPLENECMEGVDPRVIANLLTDDPDIFTR